MTAKSILKGFEHYEKERLHFVQTVADLSTKSQYADCLVDLNAIDLLSSLLSDIVPNIQVYAALALGRLANHKLTIAQTVVVKGVLPKLLDGIDNKSKHYKKSAMFLLRCVAKHSPELAEVIVISGGLEVIIKCAENFDCNIKEAAAWALGNIAKHNTDLAHAVVKQGGIHILVMCLQEPELCLKQVAASALCDICKHSADLAQNAVDSRCISQLAKAISNPDPKLKKQVFLTLSNICKHSTELTEFVVEAGIMTDVLLHLGHSDIQVNRSAAMLLKETAKHSLQLAQLIVDSGGIGPIVDLVKRSKGEIRLPALITLGFMAGHSEELALAVIDFEAVPLLAVVLIEEKEDHILAAAAWVTLCIGKHTPLHSRSIAKAGIFPILIELLKCPASSEDLKDKCKTSLKLCFKKCTDVEALEPLLEQAPPEILKYILIQYSKILPTDARARRLFATSGSLRKIQQIEAEPGSTLMECINIINCCYPEEMIRYYSPNYPELLLQQLDSYIPSIMTAQRKLGSLEDEPEMPPQEMPQLEMSSPEMPPSEIPPPEMPTTELPQIKVEVFE